MTNWLFALAILCFGALPLAHILVAPPTAPRRPRFEWLLLLGVLVFGAGCGRATDSIVVGLNASQHVLTDAHAVMVEQHRAERDAAIDSAPDSLAAAQASGKVHALWRPRWSSYERIRTAWVAASAVVRAAQALEASGGKPDVTRARAAMLDVAIALEQFAATVQPAKPGGVK